MEEVRMTAPTKRILLWMTALALVSSEASAYQYLHSFNRFRLSLRLPKHGLNSRHALGQGSHRHVKNDLLANQQSFIQQANVDDYLAFLERRYQRLEGAGTESFAWNWFLETKHTNHMEGERTSALYVLGVANLASQKLRKKDGISSRSPLGKLFWQQNWGLVLHHVKNRIPIAMRNTVKRRLQPGESTAGKISKALDLVASFSVLIYYYSVLRMTDLIASPVIMTFLCIIDAVCSSRKTIVLNIFQRFK
ncbi:hypothetical protein FisN_24Lh237 [Fistulifera solaris]|uniref:Uncharacterized protein n=1 Tax=Fistulifera solaris TaxID=1519565 RepID=A0A1Z5K9V3_FISSO|nr:hypothetical protein FisN_24Lh237 [Fistulifera solaris]|eukprot:GAX22942.1 hypothetical protein FisN_24Lh237 [Fistulifera solaris]